MMGFKTHSQQRMGVSRPEAFRLFAYSHLSEKRFNALAVKITSRRSDVPAEKVADEIKFAAKHTPVMPSAGYAALGAAFMAFESYTVYVLLEAGRMQSDGTKASMALGLAACSAVAALIPPILTFGTIKAGIEDVQVAVWKALCLKN